VGKPLKAFTVTGGPICAEKMRRDFTPNIGIVEKRRGKGETEEMRPFNKNDFLGKESSLPRKGDRN